MIKDLFNKILYLIGLNKFKTVEGIPIRLDKNRKVIQRSVKIEKLEADGMYEAEFSGIVSAFTEVHIKDKQGTLQAFLVVEAKSNDDDYFGWYTFADLLYLGEAEKIVNYKNYNQPDDIYIKGNFLD